MQVSKHFLAGGLFIFAALPVHDSIMEGIVFSYDCKQLIRLVNRDLPDSDSKSLKQDYEAL